MNAAVNSTSSWQPNGCKIEKRFWSGLVKIQGKRKGVSFKLEKRTRPLLTQREWHEWYTEQNGNWYQRSLWTPKWLFSPTYWICRWRAAEKWYTKSDKSAQDDALESAWIFVHCMKWQKYEKEVKKADDRRADMICAEPSHDILNVLKRVLLLIYLKILICQTLHDSPDSWSFMAGTSSIYPFDNWTRGKRALTGQQFTVMSHLGVKVRCV